MIMTHGAAIEASISSNNVPSYICNASIIKKSDVIKKRYTTINKYLKNLQDIF